MIQGDVFCFTKLEEALIEVNFVIEAVHEDLEDKKSLLESKTIITQQFFLLLSTYIKYFLPILMLFFCYQLNTIYCFPEVSKYCKPSVILCSSTMRLALDDIFYHVTFKEVQFLLDQLAICS